MNNYNQCLTEDYGIGVVDKSLFYGCLVFSYDLVFLAVFGCWLLVVGCFFYFFIVDVPVDGSCLLLVVGCRLSSDDC
jgi:hypothetical protein